MIASGADLCVGEVCGRVCRFLYLDRRILLSFRPVAELATAVASPGVGVAVAAHGQRMQVSGADLHVGDVCGRVCRSLHLDRRILIKGGVLPVAEPATAAASPCVDVAVAAQGQRMPTSGADLHVGEVRGRVCRFPRLDRRSSLLVCPVAEIAIGVVSPAVGVAVAAQGQGLIASAADLHVGEVRGRVCRLPDHDRRIPVSVCSVAELAKRVVSPGVGVAVAAHRQRKVHGTTVVC